MDFRDLQFPLVIISLLALIRDSTSLATTSGVARTHPMRNIRPSGQQPGPLSTLSSEDYYDLEEQTTAAPPTFVSPDGQNRQPCDYNPCRDNQLPCAKLSVSTGCLCPGFTLNNVAPEAPSLRSVSWNGSEVVLQWCAPYSYVTAYVVMVGGQERQRFGKDQRSGGVGAIDHISEVCVVAVNYAGDSDGSCMMYQPRDNSLPLKAGLIGGTLGLLLLLLLAVLLWRHKRQRKQEASISMHNALGTQWDWGTLRRRYRRRAAVENAQWKLICARPGCHHRFCWQKLNPVEKRWIVPDRWSKLGHFCIFAVCCSRKQTSRLNVAWSLSLESYCMYIAHS